MMIAAVVGLLIRMMIAAVVGLLLMGNQIRRIEEQLGEVEGRGWGGSHVLLPFSSAHAAEACVGYDG